MAISNAIIKRTDKRKITEIADSHNDIADNINESKQISTNEKTPAEKLQDLKQLYENDLITKEEYEKKKADILENMHGDLDNIEEQILITTSCKAAVKANTYLNQYQMEEIIKNWRTTENPETCPHGRPVSKFFEHKDLAKFFQRNK